MKKSRFAMLVVGGISVFSLVSGALPARVTAEVAGGMLINCELIGYYEDTLTNPSVTVRNITKQANARAAQRVTTNDPAHPLAGPVGIYMEEAGRYDVGDIVFIECTANDMSGNAVHATYRGSKYARIDSYYPAFNLNVFRNVCSPMRCN